MGHISNQDISMKLLAVITAVSFILSCGSDKGSDPGPQAEKNVSGRWEAEIELVGLVIVADLKPVDSTHTLTGIATDSVTQQPVIVYIHEGSWTVTGDTVYLEGDTCQRVDSATQSLVGTDCGPTIPIYLDIRADTLWYIQLASLVPVAEAVDITIPDILLGGKVAFYRKD
jgi:hypothetical protein